MRKLIIAGFGGQGILSLGQIMAYSAMNDNKEVSWLPSYGPEMRGGTANCSVVISDEKIASPIVPTPDIIVIMNKPSLFKFESKVQKDGYIFVNSSLVDVPVERQDVKTILVPANEDAHELGTEKAANIYMLGVINKICNIISKESIYKGIEYGFSAKPKLIDFNKRVYESAYNKF